MCATGGNGRDTQWRLCRYRRGDNQQREHKDSLAHTTSFLLMPILRLLGVNGLFGFRFN
jgi:hypothetical protein